MDAAKFHSYADCTLSASKKASTQREKSRTRRFTSSSAHTENFVHTPAELIHGKGVLLNPPISLSSSFPQSLPILHPFRQQQRPLQTPLFLLPASRTFHSLPFTRGRSSHSLSPTNRNQTPKKSKACSSKQLNSNSVRKMNPNPNPKMEPETPKSILESCLTAASTQRVGTDPGYLSKALFVDCNEEDEVEKFSGLVLGLSPPPSSLPLPQFPLRRRLSCTVEAAGGGGFDASATDDLCRLLRLR
ncbi:hypothetical protein Nepgr_005121 [Nepenthes gracilis]|uniref:Uncharacterized protein n=1 Tax=Nepenthes gracilis TaxID=150966 RepID=A0AAD3XG45_NEPGR|nr:hypothetical protein Nepgr_005121 [Nepenthes gracilis]